MLFFYARKPLIIQDVSNRFMCQGGLWMAKVLFLYVFV